MSTPFLLNFFKDNPESISPFFFFCANFKSFWLILILDTGSIKEYRPSCFQTASKFVPIVHGFNSFNFHWQLSFANEKLHASDGTSIKRTELMVVVQLYQPLPNWYFNNTLSHRYFTTSPPKNQEGIRGFLLQD